MCNHFAEQYGLVFVCTRDVYLHNIACGGLTSLSKLIPVIINPIQQKGTIVFLLFVPLVVLVRTRGVKMCIFLGKISLR